MNVPLNATAVDLVVDLLFLYARSLHGLHTVTRRVHNNEIKNVNDGDATVAME